MSQLPVFLFDLDHTLIHTSMKLKDERYDTFPICVEGETMTVHVRPFAVDLLRYMAKEDKVTFGVWTAATYEYAMAVLEGLFSRVGVDAWEERLAMVWSRKQTSYQRQGLYAKVLDTAAFVLGTDRVILLDDSPVHTVVVPRNRGRVFTVPAFHAGTKDDKVAEEEDEDAPPPQDEFCLLVLQAIRSMVRKTELPKLFYAHHFVSSMWMAYKVKHA